MKTKEKKTARLMRSQGMAITGIAKKLGVSKGSVSLWVRDIVLTNEQKEDLERKKRHGCFRSGNESHIANKYRSQRRSYQDAGKKKIEGCCKRYIAGICLYWAEGRKQKNTVGFGTADPSMNIFFVSFLREFFQVRDEDFAITIQTHISKKSDVPSFERYWLDKLELPDTCLRKSRIDKRERKSVYYKEGYNGVCNIQVNSTEIVQTIFGSISAYFGLDYEYCLD